jgi:hypothetical protein
MQSDLTRLHYDELDHNTVGRNDNEVAKFYWRPPTISNEHYDIVSTHRKRTVRETVVHQTDWDRVAVCDARFINEENRALLIECRDPHFPGGMEKGTPEMFPEVLRRRKTGKSVHPTNALSTN